MKAGDDIFDNFRNYQRQLLKEYAAMADEFGFRVLDGKKPVNFIQEDLRRQIGEFLLSSGPSRTEAVV
jgi:thymidylate kinase